MRKIPTKTQQTPPCPACSHTRGHKTEVHSVHECARCGAIHGTCYKGEASTFYLPYWHDGPDGETFHVDLTLLGSQGVERFHGWINRKTRRIVQTG
jgi:hypothetical protein